MARGESGNGLQGARALVMGLGTRQGGTGVARYLVAAGADVTVTDLRGPDALRPALDELAGLPVRYVLGEHRAEDFEQADIVVRNPGVPAESPWLAIAREAGARIEMEMSLFFRACPAPIVGITGTKGKTTTATLCGAILRAGRPETVLAGNMGTSALDALPQIGPDTPVVIELSSWQLEGLAEHGLSPHIAVLTNISEDHLNRYASMADYVDAKCHIGRFQGADDYFIVNRDDPLAWESRAAGPGRLVAFGKGRPARPGEGEADAGAFLEGERLVWRWGGTETVLIERQELPLPGEHAAMNALAAAAAALLAGATVEDVRAALTTAAPVPYRQEPVGTIDGVLYVNDTAATAPAAAIAALETYADRPVILIAGGASKRTDLAPFARRAARAKAAILLDGDATPELARLLAAAGAEVGAPHRSMAAAVADAAARAVPGDVVLLAPGCASFGLFRDEFHRGDEFRAAVARLATTRAGEVGA